LLLVHLVPITRGTALSNLDVNRAVVRLRVT
jgi:hypothetical protein